LKIEIVINDDEDEQDQDKNVIPGQDLVFLTYFKFSGGQQKQSVCEGSTRLDQRTSIFRETGQSMKKNVVKTSVEFFKFYGGAVIEKNPCVRRSAKTIRV
jgi:hypothetical protein